MPAQNLIVWDVISHAQFHEGQIVEINGNKADVYFRDQRRLILQSTLNFVRHGSPKEFLPPSKKPTGGSRKHAPEEGKDLLVAQISKGKKTVPKLAAAYHDLVQAIIAEIGSNWYYTQSFHAQVSNHKTGKMRNCFWIELNIKHQCIYMGIAYAEELPKKHHKKFGFAAKGYHGHDTYRCSLETDELSHLKDYRMALFDVMAFAKRGHL